MEFNREVSGCIGIEKVNNEEEGSHGIQKVLRVVCNVVCCRN